MSKEIEVPVPTPGITEMKQPDASIINHHRLVNNASAFPDVQFLFEDDSKNSLEAHYAILLARAPALAGEAKQKKKGWTIQMGKGKSKVIPNHVAAVYRVLVYLYTGEIDWSTYSPFQAIEVLYLAKCYNLNRLAQVNKKYIQDNIDLKNVYEVMKYAHRIDVGEVKVLCVDFALQNTEFFTSNRAKDLGFDLFQEATTVLVGHYVKKTAPTVLERKASLVDSSIVDDFISVYNSRSDSGDLIFKLVGDKQVKVHKALLSNLSGELDLLLRNNPQFVVPTRPQFQEQIIYYRLTADAFEAMLKFLYYSEKNFSVQHATQLYLFAKDYKLNALVTVLDSVMNNLEPDVQSVLYMLQIAFIELNDKKELQQSLKNKGLQFVVANLDKIDFKALDSMPAIIGSSVVEAVQSTVKKQHSNWDNLKSNFSKDTKPLPAMLTSSPSASVIPIPSALVTSATATNAATSTSRGAPGSPPVPATPAPPLPATRKEEESQADDKDKDKKQPAKAQKNQKDKEKEKDTKGKEAPDEGKEKEKENLKETKEGKEKEKKREKKKD